MTPRFEHINGKLCIMLENPEPLTKDAKFPCVVRLIQDDSPMGRYNHNLIDSCLEPFVCDGIKERHIQRSARAPHFALECYELLGYPVAEGSAEWALYQMMHGKRVCRKCWQDNDHDMLSNYGIDNDTVYAYYGYNKGFNPNQQGRWLYDMTETCKARDGWQIYTEPKEEKESPIDPVEIPLRKLILQAMEEGKNIRTFYQNMVFTPVALTGLLANGMFRWWNISNWELTDREQNYYPLSTSSDEPKQESCPTCNGTGKVEKLLKAQE